MDKSIIDQIVASSLIKEPEIIFERPSLKYDSAEIQDILNRFALAADARPVYVWVIDLLRATEDFRHYTTPEKMFAELRTLTKTQKELEDIFIKMDQALETAERQQIQIDMSAKDKSILSSAIHYCKKSIRERMASLHPQDKLRTLWEVSLLKKKCH